MTKKPETLIAEKLAEIAGERFTQDSVKRSKDNTYTIPQRKTYRHAAEDLMAMDEAENAWVVTATRFNYRPWDVAAAMERAIYAMSGMAGIGKGQVSFFGASPPARIAVRVGPRAVDIINVPMGTIESSMFEGAEFTVEAYQDENYGAIGTISVYHKKRYEASIQGFFQLVQQELEVRSIYRGKAFTGGDDPEFLDLDAVDPNLIVYSDEVLSQMETSIFSGIRYPEAMREHLVPEKRSVLLTGPYGTGKTLALMLIGQEAVANGWTFILVRPGKDDWAAALKTAQLYAPAVVAIEDVDTITTTSGDRDAMSHLLDAFDGMQAKGKPILSVVTTNHPELITKGMLRPGRLDALIHVGPLDINAVTKLIIATSNGSLDDDVNFEAVFEQMHDFLPAFVTEAVARAKRASIVRGKGELLPINTADLIAGAVSLRPQFEMMHGATEHHEEPTLDRAFANLIGDVLIEDFPNLGLARAGDEYDARTHDIVVED